MSRIGHDEKASSSIASFTARLLIVLLVAWFAALIWQLADILVLLFGAVLASVGLSAVAQWLAKRSGIGRGAALAAVFIFGLAVFGGASWIFGATVADQIDEVVKVVPGGVKMFVGWVEEHPYGRQLLGQLRGSGGTASVWNGTSVLGAAGWATSAMSSAVGVVTKAVGYAVIALFVALYLAAQPARYRKLCLRLIPPEHRPVVEQLFEVTGDVLRRWLVGQMVVMASVGVLTGLGLWALRIEAAAALGLMGGLLCFIPFVGAILAAVPATLVALTQGPVYAASVVLMYAGVHFIEGNFITPIVQAEATSLPPVLAILSTVAFSLLLGPVGVLLAAPLTLVLMSAVELLYVEHALGEAPPEGNRPLPTEKAGRLLRQTR